MIAIPCQHENRKKHGRDRKGQQRWKCRKCGATFVSDEQRPLGDMRIDPDKAVTVLGMLLEGMSIRACERLTGMKRDTICALVLTVGENCERFLESSVKNVPAETIELDELWAFIRCKSRTRERLGHTDDSGDTWTWLAIDATSKMILSHAVGQRDEETSNRFLSRLNDATTGRCQVTSDGLRLYTHGVPLHLGSRCHFAQLIKTYSSSQTETRYSPATIADIEKVPRFGNPDEDKISTSYSERLNLSVRMHVRRFTRLTNAHSKSARHHAAMMSLFVAWYNFCRPNMALGKNVSPAMAAGLTEKPWDYPKAFAGGGLGRLCCSEGTVPTIGHTDIRVSPIALGCWPITGMTSLGVTEENSLATCLDPGDQFLRHGVLRKSGTALDDGGTTADNKGRNESLSAGGENHVEWPYTLSVP